MRRYSSWLMMMVLAHTLSGCGGSSEKDDSSPPSVPGKDGNIDDSNDVPPNDNTEQPDDSPPSDNTEEPDNSSPSGATMTWDQTPWESSDWG